jgi:WD40 repeat protein
LDDLAINSSGTRLAVRVAEANSARPGPGLGVAPDGSRLFGQLGDRHLVAIDVSSGECVDTLSLPSVTDSRITAICHGPDRETAYVGASDGKVGRWSVGRKTVRGLDHSHGDGPVLIAATPVGDRVASIGADGTLRLRGADGRTLLTANGLGTPLALTFADASNLLVATRPAADSRSHLTRYEVPATLPHGRLAVTGTAVVAERILHLSASGTTFLAVTLDLGGEAVTEVWTQPTSGSVSPESVARVSAE